MYPLTTIYTCNARHTDVALRSQHGMHANTIVDRHGIKLLIRVRVWSARVWSVCLRLDYARSHQNRLRLRCPS